MTSSGICSITPESVGYMHRALLPEMSNPEASAHFTRLIEESLQTKFTQFNFFLHNLAQNLSQLKFTSDSQSASSLSFVPKTYRYVPTRHQQIGLIKHFFSTLLVWSLMVD